MSGVLPIPLGAAPICASVAITDDPDFLALPASSAVVIFETPDGRTLLIATTADARNLARTRLAPHDPAQPRSARIDYHALARGGTIHAIPVGSSLEADAVYMHQARARLPHLAQIVAERRRAWFVHVDPEAEFPQWTKTNLIGGLVSKRSASTPIGGHELPEGFLLGPFPDKDSAGNFIEKVIDCFDLCRFHNLLVQSPKAVACAYKEMGRCDAPCDGSESMEEYRGRTHAAAMKVTPPSAWIDICRSMLKAAVENQEFERAAKIHKEIERLKALDKPAYAHVTYLKCWRDVFVLPGCKRQHATVAFFDRGDLWRIGDIDPTSEGSVESVTRTLIERSAQRPTSNRFERIVVNSEQIGTIGIVARWLFLAKTKRRGVRVPVPDPADGTDPSDAANALRFAAREVCKRKSAAVPEVESQEIEGAE